MWQTGMATKFTYGSDSPLREGEEVESEHAYVSCVWCEQPVSLVGATCDYECYSMLHAWMLREGLLRYGAPIMVIPEEMVAPLPLYEQPWYPRLVTGEEKDIL